MKRTKPLTPQFLILEWTQWAVSWCYITLMWEQNNMRNMSSTTHAHTVQSQSVVHLQSAKFSRLPLHVVNLLSVVWSFQNPSLVFDIDTCIMVHKYMDHHPQQSVCGVVFISYEQGHPVVSKLWMLFLQVSLVDHFNRGTLCTSWQYKIHMQILFLSSMFMKKTPPPPPPPKFSSTLFWVEISWHILIIWWTITLRYSAPVFLLGGTQDPVRSSTWFYGFCFFFFFSKRTVSRL